MAEAPISKKRKRGNPNRKTGLIGVSKNRKKYQAKIRYGGIQHNLGSFDTKEQAGMAYDRFVVDKSNEEVFFTLNYPNGPPSSGNNEDGTDDTDLPTTTIKQDPEAELILHKAKEVHVKSEPEAEVHISPIQVTTIKQDPEAELILHTAKEVDVKNEPEADFELLLYRTELRYTSR